MTQNEIWQLRPSIFLHIHHENLISFVMPQTCVSEWTIIAVMSGTFSYEWEGVKGTASDGDLMLCPPNKTLIRKVITPLTFHYMRVNWFSPDGVSANDHSDFPIGKVTITNNKRFYSNLATMHLLSRKYDTFNNTWMNQIMSDIWYLYCADICAIYLLHEFSSEDALMNQAITLINKQAQGKINFKTLSHNIGLSHVQFIRRFKAAFRLTPLNYLTTLRLSKARTLLVETDLTLNKIAISSGFQNEYYLSKVFSDEFKVSPSQYRKDYKLHSIPLNRI